MLAKTKSEAEGKKEKTEMGAFKYLNIQAAPFH